MNSEYINEIIIKYKPCLINDTKPPLGLKPKKLHNECRVNDIYSAIKRYHEAGRIVPSEWIDELTVLLDDINYLNSMGDEK
jgi:hypothetical protein